MLRSTALGIVLLAALAPPAAGAPGKATIAVLPFDVSETLSDGESLETSVLTDAFTRVLVNTRKFTVVDRARLERVRREQKFGRSGLVDGATAARIGRLVGADYLVVGSVTDYTAEPPKEMAYGSGWTRPVRIAVEVQVVDSSTGVVVTARRASANTQTRVSNPAAAGGVPRAALEKAGEEVAQEALGAILDVAYPVKVLDVSGADVHLNRGDDGGLSVGDLLRCYAAGKRLVDPDTKEALGTAETPVGSVRVAEVLPKVTVAKIVDDQGIRAGTTCRADAAADGAGTHRAPPPPGPIHAY